MGVVEDWRFSTTTPKEIPLYLFFSRELARDVYSET